MMSYQYEGFGNRALVIKAFETGLWNSVHFQVCSKLRVEGYEVKVFQAGRFRVPKLTITKSKDETLASPKMHWHRCPDISGLESYIRSEMHSIFKDRNPGGLLSRIVKHKYTYRLNRFACTFSRVVRLGGYSLVVIPNGRIAVSAVAHQICEANKIPVRFVETNTGFSSRSNRYFYEVFGVHSRSERQSSLEVSSQNKGKSKERFFKWLEPRMQPSDNSNAYSSAWRGAPTLKDVLDWNSTREMNLFLTSSSDEHWGLGPEWHLDSWTNQYQAIGATISKLKLMGETSFSVRVHPNLASKSVRHVREELREIRFLKQIHPDVRIYSPLASENTYKLMANARRVFVTNSSAGLEASGLGIPVWCFKPTMFDLVADVRKLWDVADISEDSLHIYDVDSPKAWKFFSAMHESGIPLYKETPRGNTQTLKSVINVDLVVRTLLASQRKLSSFRSRRLLRDAWMFLS